MIDQIIAKIERQLTRVEKELVHYRALEDSGKISAEGRRMFAYFNGKLTGYESALSLIADVHHEKAPEQPEPNHAAREIIEELEESGLIPKDTYRFACAAIGEMYESPYIHKTHKTHVIKIITARCLNEASDIFIKEFKTEFPKYIITGMNILPIEDK